MIHTERINIQSVAKEAGVSIKTVSRVINSHPDVAAETRQHVQTVIDRLGYHPNAIAQGLRGSRSYTIAFAFLHYESSEMFANPFLANIVAGIIETLTPAGYYLLTYPVLDTDASRHKLRTLLRSQRVDGVIFSNTFIDDPVMALIADIDIPSVFLGISQPTNMRSTGVTADYAHGTRLLTEYLIRKGHTRIGHILGDMRFETAIVRLEAFRETMLSHNLPLHEDWVQPSNGWAQPAGAAAARRLLTAAERPTAIVAANDLLAIGAIDEVIAHGLRVPEDIAVVGFDDIALLEHLTPALTTARTSYFEFGYMAAKCLQQLIADPQAQIDSVSIPVEIVERCSA